MVSSRKKSITFSPLQTHLKFMIIRMRYDERVFIELDFSQHLWLVGGAWSATSQSFLSPARCTLWELDPGCLDSRFESSTRKPGHHVLFPHSASNRKDKSNPASHARAGTPSLSLSLPKN